MRRAQAFAAACAIFAIALLGVLPTTLIHSELANPLAALTEASQSAFPACAVLAGIGQALAFPLPGRPQSQRASCQSLTRPMPLPQDTW